MAIAANLTVALGLDSARFRRGLDRSQRRTQQFSRRVNNQLTSLTRGFAAVAAAAATIGAGVGFTRAADAFVNINNLLRASTDSSEDLATTFGRVQQIAVQTRSDLEATGTLFARIARSTQDLGVNLDQVEIVTRAIQQSFVLSGASAQEAANAAIQLSQGLASGALRGDELRSVLEQAPVLAGLIADELGVSVGQLRELGAQGMITTQVVIGALLNGAIGINDQFSQTTATFEQLGNVFNARIVPVLGQVATQLLPAVASTFEFMSQLIIGVIERARSLNLTFDQMRLVMIAVGAAATRAFVVSLLTGIAQAALALPALITTLRNLNTVLRTTSILSVISSGNLIAIGANVVAVTAAVTTLNTLLPESIENFEEAAVAASEFSINVEDVQQQIDDFNLSLQTSETSGMDTIQALDEGFQQVGRTIQTSLRDTFVEAFREGELSARSFFNSITNSILQVASNALTNQLLGSIFQAAPAAGTFLGFNQGGVVPRIPGSRPGVDSVPALLTPGEIVTPAGEIPGGVTIVNNFTVDTPETFRRQAEGSAGALADIVEAQFAQRGIA